MNKNMQRTLTYFIGTIAAFCTFIGVLLQFTKELAWVLNYTMLLTILGWMMYMQLEMADVTQSVRKLTQRIEGVETGVTELHKRSHNGR